MNTIATLPQESSPVRFRRRSRGEYLATVREVLAAVGILTAAAAGRWRMKDCHFSRTSCYLKLRHDERAKINVRISNHPGRVYPADPIWLVHLRIDRPEFLEDMATLTAFLEGEECSY